MSVSDIFKFEKFHLKDLWGRVKDNPEKLLDPVVGGLVNPMGGPKSDVYDRASAAGIDEGSGKNMHRLASLIAASYAGSYGMGQMPQGQGQGAQQGFQMPQMQAPGGQQEGEDPRVAALRRQAELRQQQAMFNMTGGQNG